MNKCLSKELELITRHSKKGNHTKALELCDSLICKFSDSYEFYETRSEIFYRMGDYENAMSDLNHVIKLMPNEKAPIFRRGRWKLKLGKYKEAIADFSTVIDSNSSYFIDSAYYFRAESYLYCKEYKKVILDTKHIPDDFSIGHNKMTKIDLIDRANVGINTANKNG